MRHLELIAHDIRSRENIGALFRVCDSLGVAKLWLTGYTPRPPDEKISKVALGAELAVSFETAVDIDAVFARLAKEGTPVYALELTPDAIDISAFVPPDKMALLLGTETTGVPKSLLARCEAAIKIPQRGMKESLNVTIAAAIASWEILR